VTTPLSVYLPFNREGLGDRFTPAKHGTRPPEAIGHWLIVQDQRLIVMPDGNGFRLPTGRAPGGFGEALVDPLWLGTLAGIECWVGALGRDAPLPEGYQAETLVPMQGTRLPDDLLSLGGMTMQALWWETTSGHCPRCGERTERLEGEWGKRCPRCRYEHYPHLHPAVIVLVRKGDRCLLARKAGWAPGRYALVAGFVDNGESLEGAVAREVKEEVGIDVKDIRYVGSQNWPFPSQLMVGFVATYAGGEITIDRDELEDARWFPGHSLPDLPSRHSISRFIIDHYGAADPGHVDSSAPSRSDVRSPRPRRGSRR
jgi:NAD+ diphosphatase